MDEIWGPTGLNRNFIRIKVEVDTTSPLLAGFWYKIINGDIERAEVKYERLLEYYFGCDKIGHIEIACKIEIAMSETGEGGPMYGPWIRAERPRKLGQQCWMIGKRQRDCREDQKKKS